MPIVELLTKEFFNFFCADVSIDEEAQLGVKSPALTGRQGKSSSNCNCSVSRKVVSMLGVGKFYFVFEFITFKDSG
jgi:hypothetical protein